MASVDQQCPKKPCHGLLGLTGTEPDQEHCILVGQSVCEAAADRLGWLSGLEHAAGLAELPESVQLADFQLWYAACVVGSEPPTEELVTVLRVADALGDSKLTTWTELLGERINETNWPAADQADAMAYALLSLPPHLLRAALLAAMRSSPPIFRPTFLSAMRTGSQFELEYWGLIDRLPPPLRSTALAAAASPDRPIHIPYDSSLTRLQLLRTATFPPPGLLRLHVDAVPRRSFAPSWAAPHETSSLKSTPLSQAAAALLAHALAAHPSLTSLRLSASIPPQWLATLTTCLRLPTLALPNISYLEIEIAAEADTGSCAALARCLDCLPSLRSLTVIIDDLIEGASRHEERPGAPSAALGAAACPARLSNLTELTVSRSPRGRDSDHRASGAVLQLLSLLSAPALVDLSLSWGDAEHMSAVQLCGAVRHFAALQRMTAQLPLSGAETCVATSATMLPPSLQSLEVRRDAYDTDAAPVTAAMLAAVAPATLTHLLLARATKTPPSGTVASEAQIADTSAAWTQTALALGRLRALRSLRLNALCASLGPDTASALCSSLSTLTALTDLSLQRDYAAYGAREQHVLCAARVVPALQQMRGLQRLQLCDLWFDFRDGRGPVLDDPLRVVEACSVLRELSRLVLSCSMDRGRLAEIVPLLPALRRLWLDALGDDGNVLRDDVVAAEFPGVAVRMQYKCRDEVDSGPEDDGVRGGDSDASPSDACMTESSDDDTNDSLEPW